MGWSCTLCTYNNKNNGAKACFTCGSDRTFPPAAEASQKNDKSDSIDLTPNDDGPTGARKRIGDGSQRTLFGEVAKSSSATSSLLSKEPSKKKAKTSNKDSASSSLQQSTLPVNKSSSSGPSYKRIPNETFESRAKRCREIMKDVFGIPKLRNQQPKAVEGALKGQSQIVVMATGGGKSLCYQLPAVVIGGTTVIVSPLIALMRDQVDELVRKGIAAACISSANTEKENNLVRERLLGRRMTLTITNKAADEAVLAPLTLVYVTPESLQTPKFQSIIKELHQQKRLAGFAIDEAHCLSTWGHDFRVSYRRLDWIASNFPGVPLMALTATATAAVIKDIRDTLKLQDAPCHLGSFDRSNIFYKVYMKDGLEAQSPGSSMDDLAKFIKKQHKRAKKAGEPCSGIVYCHKREDTTYLSREIEKRTGIRCGAYHGALKSSERTKVQQDWTSGQIDIAFATVAFGMGIDLAYVRYVVHWSIPKTMDGFYQESGRAGRDGKPAISLVYFSRDDANKFAFLLTKQEENKNKNKNPGEKSNGTLLKRNQDALQKVVDYCTTPHCRRQFVLKHFGEVATDPKTVCQKSCDFCCNPDRVERALTASDSYRAMAIQKKQNAKFKSNAKKWDGQWNRPHGDDENFEGNAREWEDFEVEGLGITSAASARQATCNGFVSAGSLKKKLDKLEAMEENEGTAVTSGFVRFKAASKSTRTERDLYPEHFRAKLENIPLPSLKPKPKELTSSESAANVDSLRSKLAEIQAAKEKLMSQRASKTTGAPPQSIK